jgi:hypothetical protein
MVNNDLELKKTTSKMRNDFILHAPYIAMYSNIGVEFDVKMRINKLGKLH